MSSESNKMKPKTDFELILNYSDQCNNWKKLENESGAGANAAALKADNGFSATEPLSEIVWSPDKGFSLKCVDSSFTNKNTSLFRDVEPSNMVLALLQTVTCGSPTTDKPIDDVFVEPLAVICTKSDVSSTDTPAPASHPSSRSLAMIPEYKACEEHDTGSGDKMKKKEAARGTPNLSNGRKDCWENNTCAQANIEIAKVFEIMDNKSSTISGQVDQRPIGNLLLQADESKPSMEPKSSPKKHCKEIMDTGFCNQVFEKDDISLTRDQPENMIEDEGAGASGKNLISSRISHSKKLELTAGNDLQIFNFEATSAATSRILVSKSKKNKNKSQVNEMMLPCSKNLPVMHSPCDFRFHMTRNESELKSLSDRYSNSRLSEEENDSYICCETYHSTKLFLSSRKRCRQEVRIGNKKAKKQTQETSYSNSLVKRDSSFMNLISNMMKGYSLSSHDGEKYLAPELPHNHKHISHLNNCKIEETREQFADIQLLSEPKTSQSCINKEASTSIKDEEGNNDHSSKHKFKRITRFPRSRDSEPLVSMFARRLVAIKQCQQTD